jgi:hypothetical protein
LLRLWRQRSLLRLRRLQGALLAPADPILQGWAHARGGWWVRTRRRGDFRSGRARWCGDLWRRTRRHGRTLLRRSLAERRCGGLRHSGGRCGARHGRRQCGTNRRRPHHGGRRPRPHHDGRWCRTNHGGRWRRGSDHGRGRSRPSHFLGERVNARRYHRNAEKKCCKAKAERKHDRRYLAALYRRPLSFNAPQISTRERGNRSATVIAALRRRLTGEPIKFLRPAIRCWR